MHYGTYIALLNIKKEKIVYFPHTNNKFICITVQENSSGLLCLRAFPFLSDKDVHSTETNFINHQQEV